MDDPLIYTLMLIATLVVYCIIESRVGLKQALVAAIVMTAVWLGLTLFIFGDIDWITGVEVALLLGMALVSWKTQSALFFKFQPVVVGFVMAALTLGSHAMGKPIIVEMMVKYTPKLAPDNAHLLLNPVMIDLYTIYNFWAGIFFLVHALILIWAALRLKSSKWAAIRIVGFYVLQFIALFISFATVSGK